MGSKFSFSNSIFLVVIKKLKVSLKTKKKNNGKQIEKSIEGDSNPRQPEITFLSTSFYLLVLTHTPLSIKAIKYKNS
jgi:hypothetical protein